MTWMLAIAAAWSAPPEAVRATVELSADGARIVSAVRVTAAPRVRTEAGGAPSLWVLGADGARIHGAAIPDARVRSVVLPDGSGATAVLDRALVRVELDWPAGAVSLALSDTIGPAVVPRPPVPPGAVALAVNGPSEERLDLVILGDGYRAAQLELFAEDAQRVVDYLLEIEPYTAYADLLNIWRIDTASNDSGVSHAGAPQDTAFECEYDCFGVERLVCCDDTAVLTRVNEVLPDADGILVLVNDPLYGGSGGFNFAVAYNGPVDGVQVAAHELGHSLVGLWDEYSYGVSGSGSGPNCAPEVEGHWDHWSGVQGVDAFPECSYTNLVRPTDNGCMMRTLLDDYCAVCREAVVLELHARLPGLIRAVTPTENTEILVPANSGRTVIDVETTVDRDRLDWTWSLDGEVVSTDRVMDLDCTGYTGSLTLHVQDPTGWVRLDANGLLHDDAGPWLVSADKCVKSPEPITCACDGGSSVGASGLLGVGLALAFRARRR